MKAQEARELTEKNKPIRFEKAITDIYSKVKLLAEEGKCTFYTQISDAGNLIEDRLIKDGYNVSVSGDYIIEISW